MKIALLAGHNRAFYYHGRDPGALPTNDVKAAILREFPNDPIHNEHHEAEKLCMAVKKAKPDILVCPFYYDLRQKRNQSLLLVLKCG